MKRNQVTLTWFALGAVCALMVFLALPSCSRKATVERSGVAEAAIATYVAPGDLDRVLPLLLGRAFRQRLCGRHSLDAAYFHDPGVYSLPGYRLWI